jgi:hypothetical protein
VTLAAGVLWAGARATHAPSPARGPLYSGIWMTVPEDTAIQDQLGTDLDLDAFTRMAEEKRARGLVLVHLRTYLDGGARKWAGVWRTGSDAGDFAVGLGEAELGELVARRHDAGQRLADLETYVDGGTRRWAGVWRAGTDADAYSIGLDRAAFDRLAVTRRGEGLRLVDLVTYREGGARKWGGVWRAGSDSDEYALDLTPAAMESLVAQHHSQEHVTLVSLEIYDEDGPRFAGLWRGQPRGVANYYENAVDPELLAGFTHAQRSSGRRALVALAVVDSTCPSSCQNQVVVPDDPSTPGQDSYSHALPATPMHCAGPASGCPQPSPGDVVEYRAPVVIDGDRRYPRFTAMGTGCTACSEQLLTLPFSDHQVVRRATWLDAPGSWHFGIDYARDDRASFEVKASAPGKVIYVGWDSWWGNTVVVSHDFNHVTDAYRTIYTHLRDTPQGDCDRAWTVTVPTLSGTARAQYEAFLDATGCRHDGPRRPGRAFWGSDADHLDPTLLGRSLQRGQLLGHAGQTGPGGCACTRASDASYTWDGAAGTQLHVFYARRDHIDHNWYLVDPYGIYAAPACYPEALASPVDTDCARYPVSWLGHRPQYP